MAINTTTTHANQIQRFYDRVLLEHAVANTVNDQFAKREELPQHSGTKSIRFFRKQAASAADVELVASEGVPSATYKDQTYTAVDVDLTQYTEKSKWSDLLEGTSLLKVVTDGIATMGEDVALKIDDTIYEAIAHATTGGTKRYAGATSFAAFDALTPANGKITMDVILDATTRLRMNNAPRIKGEYVGVASPPVLRDVMKDSNWVNAKVYSDVQDLYKAEAGTFWGVRFVMSTNTWAEDSVEGTRDTTPDSDANYLSFITGKDAYGAVNLSGMSPWSPHVMVCDKPDKSDPANQFMTAALKFYYGTAVLNQAFIIALRSKTLFTA